MAAALDPDEVLRSTTGKANFQRLTRPLISGGTALLRETFDQICRPSVLPMILSNPATKKQLKSAKLTKPQWDCLYPSPGVYGKSTNFDITLLFRLLRTICGLIPPPTGWDALPASTDHSLAANLARIKYYRNSVYGHVNQEMEITDERFPSLWEEIREALVGIAGQISLAKKWEWQMAIDKFLKDPLTAEDERNVQELLTWYKNDLEVKKSVEELKVATQGISQGMERLETSLENKGNYLEEVVREQGQDIKDQLGEMHQAIDRLSSSAGGSQAAGGSYFFQPQIMQPREMVVASQEPQAGGEGTAVVPIASMQVGLTEAKLTTTILEEDSDRACPEYFEHGPERLLKTKYNALKVSSGSPSVYKLSMEVEFRRKESMIARQSIGGGPSHLVGGRTEKVLMVVGATGAGKTTLINAMVNHILGVERKNDFRYKLVIEDDRVSQANSQTKDITAYTFYPMEGSVIPYIFTIIDTPGYGDTEGLKRDRAITNQIKEFFSIPPPDGIDHLDGIGFVIQSSLVRLTPPQKYIFDSILSIFGKDVAKNIFMLVTFADGQKLPVMDALKKAKIPSQKFYEFNNLAVFAENTEETKESFGAMYWKMNVRSFKAFFAEFEKSETVSLQLTQEVLKEREQLQTLIEGLNVQITMGLNKIEEMRQEENVLKQRETEIETNKSFTYSVEFTQPYEIDIKGTGQHTTTCRKCNFTCHQNCIYADDDDKHSCSSMDSNGYCNVCTKHCYWNKHRNLPYLIEYKVVTEIRTSDHLKKKYETAVSGKSKVQGMVDQLDEYLVNVHTTVLRMIVQVQQILRRLHEIALKPNPLTQVQYLELLIESEKNEAKAGWKKRVQYYEEAKRQAQMLSKLKDVKAVEKMIQETASSPDKWYSRFKYW